MHLIFQFAKSLLSEKIRNRFKTHSNLEHLQKSVSTSTLPLEYGGTKPVKECIQSWKVELEENRASLLDLDLLKVDHSPLNEHSGVVRKKSRHDSDSGSQVRNDEMKVIVLLSSTLVFQVLGMMGSMRKHELAQNEQ